MDPMNKPLIQTRSRSALQHARDVSDALKEAAKKARLSKRSRRKFGGDSFSARRGAAFLRILTILSFLFVFAIPTIATGIYFMFLASDQFFSEAEFTVSSGLAPTVDGIPALGAFQAIAIIQDTQIVTNYVVSRAAVELLEQQVDLRSLYSKSSIDWFSRFNAEKPIEKLVDYWKSRTSASIKLPGGIVTLRVRAFSPEDALKIAQALITASERLINEMDERMQADAIKNAEQQVASSAARLADTRMALETARNASGILDTTRTAEAIGTLLTNVRGALLQQQQEYQTQLNQVSADAPQMRLLKSRIDATGNQISELEAMLTRTKDSTSTGTALSGTISRFAELDLEHKIAERLYAGALAGLEVARLTAQKKMMYLTTFIQPVAAQDAEYPRRILSSLLALSGFLVLWGICCLIIDFMRKRLT